MRDGLLLPRDVAICRDSRNSTRVPFFIMPVIRRAPSPVGFQGHVDEPASFRAEEVREYFPTSWLGRLSVYTQPTMVPFTVCG